MFAPQSKTQKLLWKEGNTDCDLVEANADGDTRRQPFAMVAPAFYESDARC